MWSAEVPGILTFRGNPTRTYYGRGPVPSDPRVRWYLPEEGGLCRQSRVGGQARIWCGSGWTGQPAVFERDGRTWVVFGAYDGAVHFLDADTGEDILPPFQTGDIIKGSVTVDPDGYPLVYTGSRDNYYRVLAIDRPGEAVELWKLSATAVSPTLWNDDWDGSGLVLDDLLLEGGENSQFHVAKLNRSYGDDGLVTVAPDLVWNTPSWDDQVIADLAGNRAREMSVENSVAVSGNTVYFANSGGLLTGWDLSPLRDGGTPTQTFRFWTGDDTDASVVIDDEGFLYVAVEYERGNARAAEVGQLIKLDPRRPEAPVVWSYDDRGANPAGFWATPALHEDVVINATNSGKLLALDRATGAELWSLDLAGPTWQSPVVVDDTLVYGDCNGVLRGYDVSDPRRLPTQRWEVALGGCIESTPAVWKGRIFVGTRAGKFFSLGDDGTLTSPTASSTGGGGE
jgi:outer membrane protein assembly factor BamB